jgi:hypothetical protein
MRELPIRFPTNICFVRGCVSGYFVVRTFFLLLAFCSLSCLGFGCSPTKPIQDALSGPVVEITPSDGTKIMLLPGQKGTLTWTVKNRGKTVLRILNLSTSCGCAKARIDANEIPAGESACIYLDFNGTDVGTKDHVIQFETNDPHRREIALPLRAVIQYPIEVFPASLSFEGDVGESIIESVVIRPLDDEPLIIESVDCDDSALSQKILTHSANEARVRFVASIQEVSRRTAFVDFKFNHSLGEFVYRLPVIIAADEAANVSPTRVLLADCQPGAIQQLNFKIPTNQKVADVRISPNLQGQVPFSVVRYTTNETDSNVKNVLVQLSIGDATGYQKATLEFHFENSIVESIPLSGFVSGDE